MTSLAQQLQRLAVPEARATAAAQRKDKKSLLFDPAEAGGLDKETFYAIGVNGLQELQGIDPRFQDFESLLFDEASKSLERSVETREVNDKLDKKIRRFLLNVSPYFLLKPAQKAIEWLVYRFHIEEYNADDLMRCILPYHETKIFVRAIQLLHLKNKKSKWHWLAPIQKPGVSLSRLSLVTHCISDPGFLHFICEVPVLAIKAHKKTNLPGGSSNTSSSGPLRVVFSFYAATIVSAISTPGAVKEAFLAAILPFLIRGLKLDYQDYNGATYMIICQLGVSATLKNTLLEPLMETMCEHVKPGMVQQMLGCLAVLCRTQNLKQLPDKVMFLICSMPKFVTSLTQLSKSHNITPLLFTLLPHLTTTAINAEANVGYQFPEGCSKLDLIPILTQILREIHLDSQIAVASARSLLHGYVSARTHGLDDEDSVELREKIAPIVQSLERRFPEAMDLVLESYLAEVEDEMKKMFVQEFVSVYSGGMKHQLLPESNTSLVLSLNHANPDVRRMAVSHVSNLINQGGEIDQFFQESLLQRLQDDSLSVVGAVLEIDERLCEVLPVEQVFEALRKLLNKKKKRHGSEWFVVIKGALKILTSQTFASKAVHLLDDGVTMTIPHLFTTTESNISLEIEMRADIMSSHLAYNHAMLKGLKTALTSKRATIESKLTTKVLDLLGKNMAALNQEQRDKMVSSLLSHLESTSRPEAYRLIVTTIFLRALQHVPGDECKLYMARRLFAVLEVEVLKTCQKNVELVKKVQGEEEGEQEDSFEPLGVPSNALPPQLHHHLTTLMTLKKKHRLAGKVYLHSSQVQVMLWTLESMVLSLAPSISSLTPDSKWWVPGTEEGPKEGQFVTFMLQLVDLLTHVSSECHLKDDRTKRGFRIIMQSVMKNVFTDSTSFLKLLSIGWLGHVIPSQPIGFKPSPLFQVRCLNLASAIFSSMEAGDLTALLGNESFVVPHLLIPLSNHLDPVRSVALKCLTAISSSYQRDDGGPYHWLIQRLLKKTEAIELDSQYIKQALSNSLMKAHKFPEVTFPKQEKTKTDVKGSSALQAKQCMEWLLDYITQEGIPHPTQRALLQVLELVDSEIVLSSLLDLLQQLLVQAFVEKSSLSVDQTHSLQYIVSHMTPQTAHLMCDQKCIDLLLELLSREKPVCDGLESPLEMTLKQMTGAFFTALPTLDVQQSVLSRLIDLQVDTNNSVMANQLARVIKKLPLAAAQVVKELSQIMAGQKPKSIKDARRVRQKQKTSPADDLSQSTSSEGRAWQRIMIILENLQQRKLRKMEDRHTIVQTLFNLLSLCLELPTTDQGSGEYIKQLLLTTILNICDHLGDTVAEGEGPLITEEQFSVELVVQCIRTSDNPQTHNHALLLLATAAKLFPEHVLHNIMAIFTFMGASLLRQDDSHSFQIIHKTVQTVIPALVKASKDQSLPSSLAGNLEDVVTMVMQTFVDAFPHIPEHRRLPLFTHLVQSVGGAEYLWRVILLLIGGYATKGATAMLPEETETKGPGRNLEFWLTLCHHFDPETQVISLTKMLTYLATLKGSKEGTGKMPSHSRSTRSMTSGSKVTTQDLIFDEESHSPRQLRHFKFTSVGFLSQLLTSDPFIAQLVNLSEEKSAAMQALYQKLLEQTLCYITHVAHCIQDNTDPNTAKFWRALLHKAYDVLEKVNYLLPAKVFIGVVSGLLGNHLPTVRRKAMELLNNKLIQNKEGFEDEEVTMLLSMIDTLIAIAKSSQEKQTETDELDINRQTALYSLKLLCKLFGSENRKEFTQVMQVALDVIVETQSNNQVIASGLLCLAETVSSLKAHAIPYLSRFMPPLLETLSSKNHAASSDLHLLSTVTAIQKILETLPHFLSPYLGQLLQQMCRLSGNRQDEEKSQLTLRLKACCHQLSTALPSRVLIPAVSECYKTIVSTNQTSIGPLMSILSDHLDQLAKEDLLSHHHAVVNLFLQALDYRSTHADSMLEEVLNIEGHVISAVNTMVMKLSEATFRPMFLKIYEWATRSSNPDRLLTFYRLSDAIADKLKSLFCLFAGHLVANIAATLDANNVIKTDKPFFEGNQSDEKSASILGYALDCLHKCFLYDKGDFVSKERFEKLMQPLVDQIENIHGGDDVYEDRITAHLTPCIVQFMVAARDPSTWQPLNYQILLKTRNASSKVRYAALTVLQSIHSQLGEDYLSLLPETIPFLAELMEDESEEVEQRCQDVVSELEKTLGEPLQKYF